MAVVNYKVLQSFQISEEQQVPQEDIFTAGAISGEGSESPHDYSPEKQATYYNTFVASPAANVGSHSLQSPAKEQQDIPVTVLTGPTTGEVDSPHDQLSEEMQVSRDIIFVTGANPAYSEGFELPRRSEVEEQALYYNISMTGATSGEGIELLQRPKHQNIYDVIPMTGASLDKVPHSPQNSECIYDSIPGEGCSQEQQLIYDRIPNEESQISVQYAAQSQSSIWQNDPFQDLDRPLHAMSRSKSCMKLNKTRTMFTGRSHYNYLRSRSVEAINTIVPSEGSESLQSSQKRQPIYDSIPDEASEPAQGSKDQQDLDGNILVTGATGHGKSLLVAAISGGTYKNSQKSSTVKVTEVSCELKTRGGSNYNVMLWDTPGLFSRSVNQEEILKQITENCLRPNFVIHCLKCTDPRLVHGSSHFGIQSMVILTSQFGKPFWRNAIVVLTFADCLKTHRPRWITMADSERKEAFGREINRWEEFVKRNLREYAKVPSSIVDTISFIPVGYYSSVLLNRDDCIDNVKSKCVEILNREKLDKQGTRCVLL